MNVSSCSVFELNYGSVNKIFLYLSRSLESIFEIKLVSGRFFNDALVNLSDQLHRNGE
jgi:hypothetical protein